MIDGMAPERLIYLPDTIAARGGRWVTTEELFAMGGAEVQVTRELDGKWKAWVQQLSGCTETAPTRAAVLDRIRQRVASMLGTTPPVVPPASSRP